MTLEARLGFTANTPVKVTLRQRGAGVPVGRQPRPAFIRRNGKTISGRVFADTLTYGFRYVFFPEGKNEELAYKKAA